MSVKSKHSSKKSCISKKDKKKKLEYSDEDIESSEEELDLTKECHPIGYYLNDKAEMVNQMFSVIKGNKLKAMLPPILKDCDIEQLKLQCLDQLLGMSEKRITCILEGETLETSSESEVVESDEYDSNEKNGTSGSSTGRSEELQDECYTNNLDNKYKKRKGDSSNGGKAGKLQKTDSEPVEQGKTLLEILELEMRARAIRALLKQSSNEKGSYQIIEESKLELNGAREVPGEVVDLTECEDDESSGCIKKDKLEGEDIDKNVSSFEEKIEKSKTEKQNSQVEDKAKRLQAELELRNKLFKKKIYRTRQQRMENEEEEKNTEKNPESEENTPGESLAVVIKKEPVEPEEVVVEDPEEGEISTSEDEYPVEIKQEPTDEPKDDDFEAKVHEDAERVTAMDNGTFVSNSNLENIMMSGEAEREEEPMETRDDSKKDEARKEENENQNQRDEEELEAKVGETSWRDRWLQKDGVQKLVKSSKIYAKVKKRIAEKSQKAKEEIPTPSDINSDSNSQSKIETIEGRIEEYERLSSKSQLQKEDSSAKIRDTHQSENSENIMENLENSKTEKT